jgi:hypothetical protein
MRLVAKAAVLFLPLVSNFAFADSRDASSEARDYVRDYARCMVPIYHREVVDLVTSGIDAADLGRRFPQLVSTEAVLAVPLCTHLFIRTSVKVNFDGEPLRFALAEALIERDWKSSPPVNFADAPALSVVEPEPKALFEARMALISSKSRRAQLQASHDKSVAMAWLMQYGECVVRRQPVGSKAWILTVPESKDEDLIVAGLKATFGACLAEGETLNFNKGLLRGTVAVSFVRLAVLAQSGQHGASR